MSTPETSCFLVRMAFQVSHFYSHITICSFCAPLREETSVGLALGPSAKILYIAIIPLYCCVASLWLCQEAPAVLPLFYIYMHKGKQTHHFLQTRRNCSHPCIKPSLSFSVLHKHFICIPSNSLSLLVYSRYFVLVYPPFAYIYPSSLNRFAT